MVEEIKMLSALEPIKPLTFSLHFEQNLFSRNSTITFAQKLRRYMHFRYLMKGPHEDGILF